MLTGSGKMISMLLGHCLIPLDNSNSSEDDLKTKSSGLVEDSFIIPLHLHQLNCGGSKDLSCYFLFGFAYFFPLFKISLLFIRGLYATYTVID